MQIIVNGEPRPLDRPLTVAELLDSCRLAPQRVAVEVNEQLVKRARYPQTHLRDGDRVEIVTLVGGG